MGKSENVGKGKKAKEDEEEEQQKHNSKHLSTSKMNTLLTKTLVVSSAAAGALAQGNVPATTPTTLRPASTSIPTSTTGSRLSSLLSSGTSARPVVVSSSSSASTSTLPAASTTLSATSPCKYVYLPQRTPGVPPSLGVSCPAFNAFTNKYQYSSPISTDAYYHNLQQQQDRYLRAQRWEVEQQHKAFLYQQQLQTQQMQAHLAQLKEQGLPVPPQLEEYYRLQEAMIAQRTAAQQQQLDYYNQQTEYQLEQVRLQAAYLEKMQHKYLQPLLNTQQTFAPYAPYGYYPYPQQSASLSEESDL